MTLKYFPPNHFKFKYHNCIQVGKVTEKELEQFAISILRQLPNSKVLPFANKIAKAMDEIKSSHVYFIVQQAFGEAEEWESVQELLTEIITVTSKSKKLK